MIDHVERARKHYLGPMSDAHEQRLKFAARLEQEFADIEAEALEQAAADFHQSNPTASFVREWLRDRAAAIRALKET